MKGYFITGTDTGVGKTAVTAAICHLLVSRGIDAVPVKPVQTGVVQGVPGDLEHCLDAAGLKPHELEMALMNPCRYSLPASPHLAAETENTTVDITHLEQCCRKLASTHKLLLIEGAGGLLVPLTRSISTLDFAASLGLPLIIVARAGLGTLNHSLLTIRTAREAGLSVSALVLNRTTPEPRDNSDKLIETDNVRVLSETGGVKVIGPLPYTPGAGEDVMATRKLAVQLGNMLESDSITL